MRVVDLFSGCGGLSLGFMNAGFDVVAAYEWWDKAIEVYRLNIPSHPVIKMDLSDVESAAKDIMGYRPDMIIGGPPCQDYSSAGKRVEGSRANLTRCFALIVSAVRPKIFVMENVSRAQSSKAFADAREVFKDAGYGLTETVLNADLCGVPQDRKRFICIGVQGAEDGALSEIIESGLSPKPMTMRDYFGSSLGFEYYYRHPRSYARRAIFSIDEPSPTIRGVNRPVPKGYPGNKNDACPMNPSIRPLSTLERSLIQTFPPEFKWPSSKTDAEQMIGNAVPVKLAEYVARSILKFIDSGYADPATLDCRAYEPDRGEGE
jgi:DNA (cytosine-5)-methyltransferase 1